MASNRFSPITTNDQAGIIWILALLSAIYTLLTFIIRYIIKRTCFGWDDWIFVAASLIAFGSFGSTFAALSYGLGKANDSVNVDSLRVASEAVFAGRIFYFLTLCLSKCSVIFLIRRLFAGDMTRHRLLCEAALIVCFLCGFASILGVCINCNESLLLDESQKEMCPRQLARWGVLGTVDALTELCIVLLSLTLIWKRRLSSVMKFKVILAFSFRLIVAASAILNIWFIASYVRSSRPNLRIVGSIATQSIHIILSLFTATVPNLRSFLMDFDAAMMMVLSRNPLDDGSQYKPKRSIRKFSNILGISLASGDYRPETPPMVRGEVRAYNRGARGAGRDSDSFDEIELATRLNTSHTAAMHGALGHHYYHRRHPYDDDDSLSREGGKSVGAESQEQMVGRERFRARHDSET